MTKALHRASAFLLAFSLLMGPAYAQQKVVPESQVKKELSTSGTPATTTSSDPTLSDNSPDGKDAAGVGLEKTFNNIKSAYDAMEASRSNNKINDAEQKVLAEAYKDYSENWSGCVTSQESAAYACLEVLSPAIQDAVTMLNTLASTIGSAATNDSCNTFAKAMDIAKGAMTTYTAACGSLKGVCGWKCSSARNGLQKMNKILSGGGKSITCVTQDETCQARKQAYYGTRTALAKVMTDELQVNDKKSVTGKTAICTGKYAQLAISAVSGIASLANSFKQGKECGDETSADGSDGTTTADKCTIAANAQLPECICLKNPMLEGCGATMTKATQNSSAGMSALSTPADSTTSANGLKDSDLSAGSGSGIAQGERKPNSDAGAGMPTGGGGAGLSGSGGGGSGGSGHDSGDGAKKGIDTNVLGGSGGGGGGGGSWGGGGSGYDKSGYRSYLPGGSKDPSKLSGQQNWTKEVTGQGGKSNWEKVKDRYNDNKSSLLNN